MRSSRDAEQIILAGAQVRAGRALLRMTADELAAAAKVGIATVKRAEATDGQVKLIRATSAALKGALQDAGIEFIDAAGGWGVGVRLYKQREAKAREKSR